MSDISARLRNVPTGMAKGILHRLGVDRITMLGIHAITSKARIAGPARTIRFLPSREDIKKPPRGKPNWELMDKLNPGDILVMDAMGTMNGAVMGDMVALRIQLRGGAGVIIDGVTRDTDEIEQVGLPIFARATHPGTGNLIMWPWESDVPVQCGGVYVEKDDYVIADRDGVVVVPKALADEVATRGAELVVEEDFVLKLLRSGREFTDIHPLPPSLQAEFEQFKRERAAAAPRG